MRNTAEIQIDLDSTDNLTYQCQKKKLLLTGELLYMKYLSCDIWTVFRDMFWGIITRYIDTSLILDITC